MQKTINDDIIYGINPIVAALKTTTTTVSKIFKVKELRNKEIDILIKQKNIPFVFVDKFQLDKMTSRAQHQGIVAMISPVPYIELESLVLKNQQVKNPMILMLDEVQDANNLGAVLRVADAFSVNGVVFNKRRSIQLSGVVAKVSTGAINHVDISRVTNLVNSIKYLKKMGYFIAYLDMDGEQLLETVAFDLPLAIIVGGEDKGITENIKNNCDFGIKINMTGHVNSLNVACATALLCYQRTISL